MSATTTARSAPARKRGRRGLFRGRLLFALPAGVVLLALSVYPLIQLVRMSVSAVTSATLNVDWAFVGLQNFVNGWQQGDTQNAIVNTLVFVVIVTGLGLVGGFAAAVALRANSRAAAVLLGLMVFVWALPPVVNGSVWKFLLGDNGLFNSVLHLVGLESFPFLYDTRFALVSVALVNAWAIIPFNALVFRAAILGVPGEVFEAAQLDGARPWQEVRHVMMPAVRPTSLVLVVLTVVYAFRSFDFIYVMTYGGPGTTTNTLPFLGYLQAFVRYDFGLGSSTALIAVLFVIVLAVVYARSVRKEELE
ncbi:carbohydrate ABC transporter permease [Herbiconiux sp. P17]|uniref:carbohydrate ABC transporter permease n=1 Tax=Herbiconiux wuyangfengii TaxID=3342794 RepID=UPI0035B98F68